MRTNAARAALAVALLAVAVVLFVVLKDDDGGGETAPTTAAKTAGNQKSGDDHGKGRTKPQKPAVPTVVVKDGKPVGGVQEIEVEKGEEVRFRVVSDVNDEVHLHGYDISKDVEAGGSISFDFPADIEGVFEAELEERKEQIIELRVNP